mgnify:FL=1|tara:strand:- start:1286 stop:1462 length:177 start_codon:yes stop_codon:yes gene_type:complete
MNIESAKYIKDKDDIKIAVSIVIDGETLSVPLNVEDNRHWQAILEWEKKDGNEIQAAD